MSMFFSSGPHLTGHQGPLSPTFYRDVVDLSCAVFTVLMISPAKFDLHRMRFPSMWWGKSSEKPWPKKLKTVSSPQSCFLMTPNHFFKATCGMVPSLVLVHSNPPSPY